MDSSAVGIAPLAHTAGVFILCREVWLRGTFKMTLGRLVAFDLGTMCAIL